ncbi:uncharacterized protein [Argopecten irradians]|uniref:uncharacterized protein n=1 Tax=Argopecten irradians TaxID=31199 RepID=UPI00371C762F
MFAIPPRTTAKVGIRRSPGVVDMNPASLCLLLLMFGVACRVEGRGYLSRRPRPQTDLPPDGMAKPAKRNNPAKQFIDVPVRSPSSQCPRPRCSLGPIPATCRQETYFTSKSGARCKGCVINVCPEGNLNTGSASLADQIGRGIISDSTPGVSLDNSGQLPMDRNNLEMLLLNALTGSIDQSSQPALPLPSSSVPNNGWASLGFPNIQT